MSLQPDSRSSIAGTTSCGTQCSVAGVSVVLTGLGLQFAPHSSSNQASFLVVPLNKFCRGTCDLSLAKSSNCFLFSFCSTSQQQLVCWTPHSLINSPFLLASENFSYSLSVATASLDTFWGVTGPPLLKPGLFNPAVS